MRRESLGGGFRIILSLTTYESPSSSAILREKEKVGAITLYGRARPFDQNEQSFASQVADRVSTAVQNTRLFARIQQRGIGCVAGGHAKKSWHKRRNKCGVAWESEHEASG